MAERCVYRADWDPETLEPRGPECGAEATQTIHWKDGRYSPGCEEHGLEALVPSALHEVAAVVSVEVIP